VSSAQIADELGVSEMTIRRDLRQLALEGLARRVGGGATLLPADAAAPFEERDRSAADAKSAIARACAALISEASTIALDAGTTVAGLAPLLPSGVTAVSHSVPIITACTARDDLELIAVGGSYRHDTRSFAGSIARAALATVAVDIAVLSATAIDRRSVMCANTLDAEIKQGMASIAGTTVLVADHTKLGARAPIRFGALDLVDIVVTDSLAPTEITDAIAEAGVRVVVAQAATEEEAS
jgi:DeoR/GlpR family transcriptional regulator of sugar metabolism